MSIKGKKHVSQMTEAEIGYIDKVRKSVTEMALTSHAKTRQSSRSIAVADIVRVIKKGEIVEYYHPREDANRVTFRAETDGQHWVVQNGRLSARPQCIYVVFDIVNMMVVTAYKSGNFVNSTSTFNGEINILENVENVLQRRHTCRI